MLTARAILLALHIISAGAWVSQFFVEIAIERFARTVKGKPGAYLITLAQGRAASFLGQVGGMGILITGLGLLGVGGYALFGIGGFTPRWLFIKQVIYVIAMAIVGAVVIRGTRGLEEEAVAKGTEVIVPPRVLFASRLVNLLVVVNILLAAWKPM